MKAIRRFTVRTVLPEALAPLEELATNLRWSWHPETRTLFETIDAALWRSTGYDPVRLLGEISPERLDELAADHGFVDWAHRCLGDLHHYLEKPRWYQSHEGERPASIGYFSPEFGIAAALPQYSGGLGILAGDHLKAASDLGVPIVGVGLFYRSGYFRQTLSRDGWQLEQYPVLDPDGMPLSLLREADGTPSMVVISLPGAGHLHAHIWRAQVGRVPLLLLDSDIEQNGPVERAVTDRLYGGGRDQRFLQEVLLGIGGVRALRIHSRLTGSPAPEVFHSNEGHAGFLGIERIRELVEGEGLDFDSALRAVRAGTVFTTHTPVPAGIDRFPRSIVERFFSGDNSAAGVPAERVLQLGAEDYEGGDPAVFNMAVMGLRLAQRANGVSRLHGSVSRGMFGGLWEGFDADDVPITSITNGVHAPTWVAPEMLGLGIEQVGLEGMDEPHGWEALAGVDDQRLWAVKRGLRERLVLNARRRVRESWHDRGASDAELGWTDSVLDPDVLTIGFARRVPSYKRLTLMLRDPVRLKALLLHPERPIQLVIAGKSHPADDGGKRLIQDLVHFADAEDVRHRIVFLPNYEISMASVMYPGCDVWLNNPLRPLEACGTSGMKAALNGALNLSILDGWWDEWFDGENGWAIPSADGVESTDRRDDLEAAALYDLLEKSVTPTFYNRDERGIPWRWLQMMKHTLATLGPKVLATRMVRDYVGELYTPAALSAREFRGAEGGARARAAAAWFARITEAWSDVRVEHVETSGVDDSPQLGNELMVRAYVALGALSPADVEVQVVHGRVDASDRIVAAAAAPLVAVEQYDGNRWRYETVVPLTRTGPFGYTVRVRPTGEFTVSPAELGLQALPVDPTPFGEPGEPGETETERHGSPV